MRRNTTLAVGLSTVVLAAGVGWLAGRQVRSPAEVAARTAPPTASLITVPVEKTRLQSEVITRGTVGYGSPQVVSLPASALKTSSAIVTRAPERGASLAEGSVAMAVSGRPVLVLQGAVPAYRDLGPGVFGEDVHQLETALVRLGFDPGAVDGVYDRLTSAAVGSWYAAAGWAPLGPTEEQLQGVRSAQTDLFGAQESHLSALEGLNAARGALAAAEERVWAAQAALAPPPPAGTEQVAVGREVDAALAEADRAAEAVQLAQRRVALTAARAASNPLAELGDRLGVQVAADELLFFADLPVRTDDVKVKVGELVAGPVMTVTNSQLAVTGALTLDDARLVRKGATVAIQDRDLGVRASGTVTDVADTPGTHGAEPQRFYLGVTPTDLPVSLVGASVVLTITVLATGAEVLAVPVSALSVASDGSSRVEVQAQDRATRLVIVRPGLVANGLVEVTPVGSNLTPGELVVVGFAPGGAGTTPTSKGTTGAP